MYKIIGLMMKITQQMMTLMMIIATMACSPTACSQNQEKSTSRIKQLVNMVYEHRLKCATLPLIVLGGWFQYHCGEQNLSSLRVVVPDAVFGKAAGGPSHNTRAEFIC